MCLLLSSHGCGAGRVIARQRQRQRLSHKGAQAVTMERSRQQPRRSHRPTQQGRTERSTLRKHSAQVSLGDPSFCILIHKRLFSSKVVYELIPYPASGQQASKQGTDHLEATSDPLPHLSVYTHTTSTTP